MNRFLNLFSSVIFTLFFYMAMAPSPALPAQDLPGPVYDAVRYRFPGAVIREVEREVWQGRVVTEVELTAENGTNYEVYVADDGTIVHIAQEGGGLGFIGGELTLGLGVRGERGIYRDEGSEIEPVPFIVYQNGPFDLQGYDGLEASFSLCNPRGIRAGIMAGVDFEPGYDHEETYFKGMKKLDTLIHAGGFISVAAAGFDIGLECLQEATGEHDGQEVSLSLAYPWAAVGWQFTPKLSLTWLSKKSVDYLYGVSPQEARPDRSAYAPGSSYEIEAELMVEKPLWGNFSLIGLAGVSILGSAITDSPLVEKDYEIEGALGLAYTF